MAIHKFLRSALLGRPITIYGDGSQERDFTYVGDVVEATIRAATWDVEGEVMNIGNRKPIRLLELLDMISDLVGRELEVIFMEEQKGDVRVTFADISKARKLLGYKPNTRLEEGLEEELKWISSIYLRERSE